MQLRDIAPTDFMEPHGYEMTGARLVLMVEHNTLITGNGVVVTIGTLGSNAIPTLGTVATGGRVGLMMAPRSWMAVLQSLMSMAVAGMMPPSVQRMSHAI